VGVGRGGVGVGGRGGGEGRDGAEVGATTRPLLLLVGGLETRVVAHAGQVLLASR